MTNQNAAATCRNEIHESFYDSTETCPDCGNEAGEAPGVIPPRT